MAVEKLILRSILYGADKIPDSWFEKIPGGFYKDKEGNLKKETASGDKKVVKDSPRSGRKAERSDFYDDEYRSEGDKRRHRGRDRDRDRARTRASSYDGGDDDEYYRYDRDGKLGRSQSHKRRRSLDRDRRGYHDRYRNERRDGYVRKTDDRYHDNHASGRRSLAIDPEYDRKRSVAYSERSSMRSDGRSAAFATAVRAAARPPSPSNVHQAYQKPSPPPMSRPQTWGGSISSGYVPYADIYGYPDQRSPPQHTYSTTHSRMPMNYQMNRTQSAAAVFQDSQLQYSAQQAPSNVGLGARPSRYDRSRTFHHDERSGYAQRQSAGYDSARAQGRSNDQHRNGRDHSTRQRYVDPVKPLEPQMRDIPRNQYSHRASMPLSVKGQLLTNVLLDGTDTSIDHNLTGWNDKLK